MNLNVFIGPDPSANTAELFRRTPVGSGSICAVVPDFHSVTAMERRLAGINGGAFIGHAVFTPEGLALTILSLTGNIPDVIGVHVNRALLAEIVKSRIGARSRFRSVAGYPGFVRLLSSFLENVRSSVGHVTADRELLSIDGAYQVHLERLGLTDHEGAVLLALKSGMVERFTSSFSGSLIIDGFYDFTDRQLELVGELARLFPRTAVSLVYDFDRPELFSLPGRLLKSFSTLGARIIEVPYEPSNGPGRMLCGFMGGNQPAAVDAGDVELHGFQSESSESDWIAGTIRSMLVEKRCRPENIMVVSRNAPEWGGVFETACRRHGIPVDGGFVRPLTDCPPVKTICAALDASIDPEEGRITAVQDSGYTGQGVRFGDERARNLDDRGWSCMISEVDSPEGFISSLKTMIETLGIGHNLNGAGDPDVAMAEQLAFQEVIKHLDEFARFYTTFRPMMKAEEFSRLLKRYLGEITVTVGSAPGRGMLVLGVNQARYIQRDVVFFRGLDRSSFPLSADTYTLHDVTHARKLRDHHDREEGLLFYMAITGAKRLIITFPGVDPKGGDRFASMSPYLRNIAKVIQPVVHTGVAGAAWESGFVNSRGRAEHALRAIRDTDEQAPLLVRSLKAVDPGLSERLISALQTHLYHDKRRGLSLRTEGSLSFIREKWGENHLFSVTDLELYNVCPIRFFFTCVLGIRKDIDVEDGLDPATRGSVIHDILAEFYRTLLSETGRTGFTRSDLERVSAVMRRVVDRIFPVRRNGENLKRISPFVLGVEKRFVLRWMMHIVGLEADSFECGQYSPFACEITFGGETYPPLVVRHEGISLMLKGRIDRIDRGVDGETFRARIVDYKTGRGTKPKDIRNGHALQLPLYIKAAREVIVPEYEVTGGMYYNLKEAQFDRKKGQFVDCAVIEDNIEEIVDNACICSVKAARGIGDGSFPAPTEPCSDFCEWKPLCGGGASLMKVSG